MNNDDHGHAEALRRERREKEDADERKRLGLPPRPGRPDKFAGFTLDEIARRFKDNELVCSLMREVVELRRIIRSM